MVVDNFVLGSALPRRSRCLGHQAGLSETRADVDALLEHARLSALSRGHGLVCVVCAIRHAAIAAGPVERPADVAESVLWKRPELLDGPVVANARADIQHGPDLV